MVGTSGLEPLTPTMSTWCSNQLSYAPDAVGLSALDVVSKITPASRRHNQGSAPLFLFLALSRSGGAASSTEAVARSVPEPTASPPSSLARSCLRIPASWSAGVAPRPPAVARVLPLGSRLSRCFRRPCQWTSSPNFVNHFARVGRRAERGCDLRGHERDCSRPGARSLRPRATARHRPLKPPLSARLNGLPRRGTLIGPAAVPHRRRPRGPVSRGGALCRAATATCQAAGAGRPRLPSQGP